MSVWIAVSMASAFSVSFISRCSVKHFKVSEFYIFVFCIPVENWLPQRRPSSVSRVSVFMLYLLPSLFIANTVGIAVTIAACAIACLTASVTVISFFFLLLFQLFASAFSIVFFWHHVMLVAQMKNDTYKCISFVYFWMGNIQAYIHKFAQGAWL